MLTTSEARKQAEFQIFQRTAADASRLPPVCRPILIDLGTTALGQGDDWKAVAAGVEAGDWARFVALLEGELGWTLPDYLAELRLEPAPVLLTATPLTFGEVAALLGFQRQVTFHRSFARRFGVSPHAFRRAHRRESLPGPLLPERAAEFTRRFAERWTARLEKLSPAAARRKVLGWVALTPALFEALSRRSQEVGRQNRRRGLELAELALATVESHALLMGERAAEVRALALARMGNALRLAGEFDAAGETLAKAQATWQHPRKSPKAEAEILFWEAALCLAQRRYEAAYVLLNEAQALASEAGDPDLQIAVQLQRAAGYGYQGNGDAALWALRQARQMVQAHPGTHPRRALGVQQDLVALLVGQGQFAEAEARVPEAQALAQSLGDEVSRAQLLWLEGSIVQGLGRPSQAESLFRQASAALREVGDLETSALSALDLAILLSQSDVRTSEVRSILVEDVIPPLQAIALEGEKLAALTLLQETLAKPVLVSAALTRARQSLHGRCGPALA